MAGTMNSTLQAESIIDCVYVSTNLSKSIKSKITHISAHCLNIERGRYNKRKITQLVSVLIV